jgi:YVTN family beta-propeller protein
MAKFSLRKKRAATGLDAPLLGVTTTGRDFTAAGAVAMRRGPISDIAVDPAAGRLVAINHRDDTIAMIDPESLSIGGGLRVQGVPFGVAVAEDRAYVTVAGDTSDAVSVINTATRRVLTTYPMAFSVTAVTVSPDGKRVFAARSGGSHVDVAVIDTTAERVGTIDVARGPGITASAVRVDATGKRLYVGVSDARGGRLVVVNCETATVHGVVPIGSPIRDIELGPDGLAYVLTSDRVVGGAVVMVNLSTGRIADTVAIGGAPTQLVLHPDGGRLYIVDYDSVAVLDAQTAEVVDVLTVAGRPLAVAVSTDGGRLYIADHDGVVTAFDVAPTEPVLYAELMATDPIATPRIARQPREIAAV